MPETENKKKKSELKTKLKPHQQRVRDRMADPEQSGLVVAHPLGSGKTLTSIGVADAMDMPAQAIVPASLVNNYRKELNQHAPGLDMDVVSQQRAARRGNLGGDVKPGGLHIIDEAHRARNAGNQLLSLLKKVQADKRLLLTASPFYNNPADIAPLVNLAAGATLLPQDQQEFAKKYIEQKEVPVGFWAQLRGIKPGSVPALNQKQAPALRAILQKYVDYVEPAKDAEGFPKRIDESINVQMTPEQEDVYDALIKKAPPWVAYKVKEGLPPSKQEAKQLNAFLTAVRQVSNSTSGYAPGRTEQAPKIDAAISALKNMIQNNPRGKAVAYSNFLESGVDPYERRLKDSNIPYAKFIGGMSDKERKAIVDSYNTDKIKALLVSSAGGEGLDLKGTRLMQILDPHWNEEKLKQVIGRGIRYKSHEHLPENERDVRVQRYLAQRAGPGFFGKLFGRERPKAVDEYLTMLSGNKEQLHEQFRALARQAQAETEKQSQHAVSSRLNKETVDEGSAVRKLGVIKFAAPRWVKMVAKDPKGSLAQNIILGRINKETKKREGPMNFSPLAKDRAGLYAAAHKNNPEKVRELSAMNPDRPVIRRLPGGHIDTGSEKEVHQAFGDSGLGQRMVVKRVYNELAPGSSDAYYNLAQSVNAGLRAKGEKAIFNEPYRHTSGKGWFEPRLNMGVEEPEIAVQQLGKRLARETNGEYIQRALLEAETGIKLPSVKIKGKTYAQKSIANPAVRLPNGTFVGDLRAGNVGIDPRTGDPVVMDASVINPS